MSKEQVKKIFRIDVAKGHDAPPLSDVVDFLNARLNIFGIGLYENIEEANERTKSNESIGDLKVDKCVTINITFEYADDDAPAHEHLKDASDETSG